MDVSRAVLDNLMGRDRNKAMDTITQRDHYSNADVCKSFLVCFCFNTLFPNTTYDQGPCQKRHDTYLKNMFDNDPNRALYERQYIRQCIHWIQRRLQDVQKKTKQNQSVIDNKSNFPADRPKQILDRILAIDQDIQKLIADSQKYGQQGKIDDSLRCLEQVQKLRQRRKQIQLMGSDMTNAQKQQKICVICGAIQTINDTQKRIQTHLQGKIHQGFLKLRHQVEALKIRLQVLNKMNPERKQRDDNQKKRQQNHNNRKNQQSDKRNQKPKQSQTSRNNQNRAERQQRDRSDSAGRKRKRQRSRQKQRQRERSRQRRQRHDDRDKRRESKQKQRDRRSRSKDRKDKKHHRDSRQREKDRSHKQSKDHKKKHKKNRSRSKQRDPQDNNY